MSCFSASSVLSSSYAVNKNLVLQTQKVIKCYPLRSQKNNSRLSLTLYNTMCLAFTLLFWRTTQNIEQSFSKNTNIKVLKKKRQWVVNHQLHNENFLTLRNRTRLHPPPHTTNTTPACGGVFHSMTHLPLHLYKIVLSHLSVFFVSFKAQHTAHAPVPNKCFFHKSIINVVFIMLNSCSGLIKC